MSEAERMQRLCYLSAALAQIAGQDAIGAVASLEMAGLGDARAYVVPGAEVGAIAGTILRRAEALGLLGAELEAWNANPALRCEHPEGARFSLTWAGSIGAHEWCSHCGAVRGREDFRDWESWTYPSGVETKTPSG